MIIILYTYIVGTSIIKGIDIIILKSAVDSDVLSIYYSFSLSSVIDRRLHAFRCFLPVYFTCTGPRQL